MQRSTQILWQGEHVKVNMGRSAPTSSANNNYSWSGHDDELRDEVVERECDKFLRVDKGEMIWHWGGYLRELTTALGETADVNLGDKDSFASAPANR